MYATRKTAAFLGLAALGLAAAHPAQAQSLSYTFAATNTTATVQTFTFNASTVLLTTLPAGALLTNMLTGTLTSPAAVSGSLPPMGSIAPSGQTFLAEAFVNGTDSGLGVGGSETFTSAGVPFGYGPPGGYSSSTTYGSPITSLGINISFMLSAGASASFNGKVSATPGAAPPSVPEPSSVAAFAFTGLGAAALILRARKRQTA